MPPVACLPYCGRRGEGAANMESRNSFAVSMVLSPTALLNPTVYESSRLWSILCHQSVSLGILHFTVGTCKCHCICCGGNEKTISCSLSGRKCSRQQLLIRHCFDQLGDLLCNFSSWLLYIFFLFHLHYCDACIGCMRVCWIPAQSALCAFASPLSAQVFSFISSLFQWPSLLRFLIVETKSGLKCVKILWGL